MPRMKREYTLVAAWIRRGGVVHWWSKELGQTACGRPASQAFLVPGVERVRSPDGCEKCAEIRCGPGPVFEGTVMHCGEVDLHAPEPHVKLLKLRKPRVCAEVGCGEVCEGARFAFIGEGFDGQVRCRPHEEAEGNRFAVAYPD